LRLCGELPDLQIAVNTHYHEDHTGNNYWITKRHGLIPKAHPKTSSYLQAPSQWMRFYRRMVWGTPCPAMTEEVDSEIRTRKFHFLIIPTPGHSEDHLCLYEPNEGWLFSGDLFITEEQKNLREDEDIYSILDSLKRIANLCPKKMFCSFSGVIEKPGDSLRRKIEYFEDLQHGIEKGIREGLSPWEIREKLLGRGDRYRVFTGGQISKQNLINSFLKEKRS